MNRLKGESKQADIWKFIGVLSIFLGLITGYLGLQYHYLENYGVWLFIELLIAVVSFLRYTKKNDGYTGDFKELVINEMIKHLCPGAIYKPESCVPEKNYRTSCLFRSYYDDFFGENYMEGIYKNVSFHCSELKVIYEDTSVIFNGLFFVAAINPAFNGGTYVWNRDFEQLPSSIMDEEYRLMPMPHTTRVRLSNEGFNKYFSVCSTLPYQASQLLTVERMQQMANFRQQLHKNITFSFVAGHCYVAIPAKEDLLDPGDYEADDLIELKKYYSTVIAVLNIIDQLALSSLI